MNITDEINQLDQRRTALHEYLKSEEFKTEPPEMQNWARMQEGAMEQYARALSERQRLAPDGYLDAPDQPKTATAANTEQDTVPENHPARQRPGVATSQEQALNQHPTGKAVDDARTEVHKAIRQDQRKPAPKKLAVQRKAPVVAPKVVSKAKK
jgi:hypothetical protein